MGILRLFGPAGPQQSYNAEQTYASLLNRQHMPSETSEPRGSNRPKGFQSNPSGFRCGRFSPPQALFAGIRIVTVKCLFETPTRPIRGHSLPAYSPARISWHTSFMLRVATAIPEEGPMPYIMAVDLGGTPVPFRRVHAGQGDPLPAPHGQAQNGGTPGHGRTHSACGTALDRHPAPPTRSSSAWLAPSPIR